MFLGTTVGWCFNHKLENGERLFLSQIPKVLQEVTFKFESIFQLKKMDEVNEVKADILKYKAKLKKAEDDNNEVQIVRLENNIATKENLLIELLKVHNAAEQPVTVGAAVAPTASRKRKGSSQPPSEIPSILLHNMHLHVLKTYPRKEVKNAAEGKQKMYSIQRRCSVCNDKKTSFYCTLCDFPMCNSTTGAHGRHCYFKHLECIAASQPIIPSSSSSNVLAAVLPIPATNAAMPPTTSRCSVVRGTGAEV